MALDRRDAIEKAWKAVRKADVLRREFLRQNSYELGKAPKRVMDPEAAKVWEQIKEQIETASEELRKARE